MYTLTVSRLTVCNLISLFYIFHLCEGIGDVCQELWPTFSCASSKQRFSSRFGQNHRSKVRTTSECARKSSQSHSGLTSNKSSTIYVNFNLLSLFRHGRMPSKGHLNWRKYAKCTWSLRRKALSSQWQTWTTWLPSTRQQECVLAIPCCKFYESSAIKCSMLFLDRAWASSSADSTTSLQSSKTSDCYTDCGSPAC